MWKPSISIEGFLCGVDSHKVHKIHGLYKKARAPQQPRSGMNLLLYDIPSQRDPARVRVISFLFLEILHYIWTTIHF